MSVVNRMLKDLEQNSDRRRLLIDVGDAPRELQRSINNKVVALLIVLFTMVAIVAGWYFLKRDTLVGYEQNLQTADKLSETVQRDTSELTGDNFSADTQGSAREVLLKTNVTAESAPMVADQTEQSSFVEQKVSAINNSTALAKANISLQENVANTAESKASSLVVESKSNSITPKSQKVIEQGKSIPTNKQVANKAANNESVKQVSNAQLIENQLLVAEDLIKRGLFRSAETELKTILNLNSDEHRAAEQLAFVYLQLNEFENLERFLEQRIKSFPANNTYQVLLARHYAVNKQWQRIIYLTNRPLIEDEMLLVFRTLALQRLDKHNAAIELYGRLLKQQPNRGDWWIGISISLNAIGETQQALQALKRAKSDPRLTVEQRNYIDSRLSQRG